MTTPERALVLAAEIGSHTARVDREVEAIGALEAEAPGNETARWALAAHLQAFYTGIEAILVRVAETFEGNAPGGSDSRREVLRRSGLDVPSLRPKVLSAESVASLLPYLAFRHFFRHAYGVELEWDKMSAKVARAREAWERVARDLDAFRSFLTAAGLSGP